MPDRAEPSLPPPHAAVLSRLTLVLGGARSGKSRYAEALIEASAPRALYLATAQTLDDEMRERIRHHRERRGPRWTTIEEPLELPARLMDRAGREEPILVDCLTLWLSNLLLAGRDTAAESMRFVGALRECRVPLVLVANEVGLGIVPDNVLARVFRDHAGRLNQEIAASADRVVFLAAGLPLVLKGL